MKSLIIFLHGSGGNGHELRNFLNIVPLQEFDYKTFRDVTALSGMDIITPSAIPRPYTPAMKAVMSVWYDRATSFLSEGLASVEDKDGTDRSLEQLMLMISESENQYDNIFVGGFSQGGGLALHLPRMNLSAKVRGIFTMGSFLVNKSSVLSSPLGVNAERVPILMMHGRRDSMIEFEWGRASATNLLLRELNIQFKEYDDYDHEIGELELVDLIYWMQDILTNIAKAKEDMNSTSNANSRSKKDTGDHVTSPDQCSDEGDRFVSPQSRIQRYISEHEPLSDAVTDHDNGEWFQCQDCVPYSVAIIAGAAALSSSSRTYKLSFKVPADSILTLVSRPILCCGGSFDLVAQEGGEQFTHYRSAAVVHAIGVTSDAHALAVQIGTRLWRRLSDGGEPVNPCPTS